MANAVANDLASQGLTVFLAERSLQAGQQWSAEILDALRGSDWVVFLAGKAARESAYVLQEVGGAVYGKKGLIPVVWDCSPPELPGWTKEYQAINMSALTAKERQQTVLALGRQLVAARAKKTQAKLILSGLALVGGWALFGQDDDADDRDYEDVD